MQFKAKQKSDTLLNTSKLNRIQKKLSTHKAENVERYRYECAATVLFSHMINRNGSKDQPRAAMECVY